MDLPESGANGDAITRKRRDVFPLLSSEVWRHSTLMQQCRSKVEPELLFECSPQACERRRLVTPNTARSPVVSRMIELGSGAIALDSSNQFAVFVSSVASV